MLSGIKDGGYIEEEMKFFFENERKGGIEGIIKNFKKEKFISDYLDKKIEKLYELSISNPSRAESITSASPRSSVTSASPRQPPTFARSNSFKSPLPRATRNHESGPGTSLPPFTGMASYIRNRA